MFAMSGTVIDVSWFRVQVACLDGLESKELGLFQNASIAGK